MNYWLGVILRKKNFFAHYSNNEQLMHVFYQTFCK